MVKAKCECIRAISVTERIGSVDCWHEIHPKLMTQSRAGPNDVIARPWPNCDVV